MRPRKKNRHLPPCVHHKHGGYYYVKRGKWEPLGKSLPRALARYAELAAQPKGGMPDFIDAALPHVTAKVKDSTARQYKSAAKTLKKMLRNFTPEQIKQKDVAQVKRLLASKPGMANCCLTVLRVIFDYAVQEQLLNDNPARAIKPYPAKKRTRLISDDEFRAIYDKASPGLKVIMDLWRLTGQRVMDVVRIRRVDLREDGIYFKQEKTGKELIVGWNPELKAAVDRAKALHGSVTALTLLHSGRGKQMAYRTVWAQWKRARIAAGVADVQARDMRATALTVARRQGINPTALAAHSDSKTTAIYLRDREVPVISGPSFRLSIDSPEKKSGNQ